MMEYIDIVDIEASCPVCGELNTWSERVGEPHEYIICSVCCSYIPRFKMKIVTLKTGRHYHQMLIDESESESESEEAE